MAPPNRKRPYHFGQKSGTWACKYCPFRTGIKDTLINHVKSHSANHPFQCNFCTFSSKSKRGLVSHHINRVHQDELKSNGDLAQSATKNEAVMVEPTGEDLPESLPIPTEQDEEVEEVLMVGEQVLEETNCICGQPQPVYGDSSAVSCSQCDDRFHGTCVSITPEVYEQMDELEEPWICQRCLNKEPLITHLKTPHKAQTVNNSANERPSSPRYSSSPAVPDSSDDCLEPQNQNANLSTTSETLATLLSSHEEEIIYSSERSNLSQEIQSAGDIISDMKKSLEEEDRELRLARSRAANDLRKKMEQAEKEFHSESVQLVVLMEQNESFHQQLNELAIKTIQLEQDIKNLRELSVGKNKKIKLEPVAIESSSANFKEEIQTKKRSLNDAKEKLPMIKREVTRLTSRIRGMEEEMRENTLKVAKMRDDLKSLEGNRADGTRPSAIADQLKARIGEQRIRIKRLTWLEMKLANINYKHQLDDIHREKERWLGHLMDYKTEF